MSEALFNVQQAVFNKLAANTQIQALLGVSPRLYDHVSPDAVYPYVVYGPVHVAPYDTKTEIGFEQIVVLNIWSQYRGGKQTREIFQAIYDALHRATLSVGGNVFLSCEFHSADFGLDADGLTYYGAARFSILTQTA